MQTRHCCHLVNWIWQGYFWALVDICPSFTQFIWLQLVNIQWILAPSFFSAFTFRAFKKPSQNLNPKDMILRIQLYLVFDKLKGHSYITYSLSTAETLLGLTITTCSYGDIYWNSIQGLYGTISESELKRHISWERWNRYIGYRLKEYRILVKIIWYAIPSRNIIRPDNNNLFIW